MFNVAVINLKNLISNILKIIIVSILVAMIFKLLKISRFGFKANINLISKNIGLISEHKNQKINSILKTELIDNLNLEDFSKEEEKNEIEDEKFTDIIQEVPEESFADNENIEKAQYTEIIQNRNRKEVFTDAYGSVKIKNESKYQLTDEMLMPTVDFNNKNDILIFHTHTCESYTQTPEHQYIATSNYRTTDQSNSIVHIGTILTDSLVKKGFNVNHNKTYHDYPSYSGSYNRSYQTVKRELSNGAWTEFVIDLHRDAIGNGSDYGPTVKINDEIVAQLMFVIGTDGRWT